MVFRLLALLAFSATVHAAELEGVTLEDRAQVAGQDLVLNGIALRTRYMVVKVYVAGLYLAGKTTSASAAIEARGAKRIALVMLRDATAEQFLESIDAGLRANNSESELAQVKTPVDELFAKIRGIGEAKKGMRIVLDYSAQARDTVLVVDGAQQGRAMGGDEFYRALLRIWLGDNPVQEDLKKSLLGGG
jgi:hypothetical protein